MILKFLAQKTGSPFVALNYVDGSMHQGGDDRDEIRLIAGSPEDFLHAASGLTFQEKFKSCVLSWSPGDAPSDDQLEEVLADFFGVGYAGMDPNHFCHCVYLHRKHERVDVHILIANVHLETGKHFNAAPPEWMASYDPVRDVHNARWGWASPKDPELARPIRPIFDGYGSVTATGTLTPATSKNAENDIQEAMLSLAMRGVVNDRASLLLALADHGEVNRGRSKEFVSIRPTGFEKPVRLRGVIFREDFEPSMLAALAPTPRPARTAADHEADKDPAEEAAARARLDAAVARRAIDNHRRYLAPRQRASKKKAPVAATDAVDLPPIDLAVQRVAQTPMTTNPVHREVAAVTGPGTSMPIDTAMDLWSSLLKQPSPTYKDEHEPDADRAVPGVAAKFGERLRREFDRLARTIEGLGRAVQALAGRLGRRRQAERARRAVERSEEVEVRAERDERPGTL